MSNNKRILVIGCLGVLFLGLILCCCAFFYLTVFANLNTTVNTTTLFPGDNHQVVAVIDIKDVISSAPNTDFFGNTTTDMVTRVNAKIDRAINDDDVKAVIFRVDSPGGEVYATKEIYNKILELKSKNKKVVVLMQSMAASGAYYLSAPADKIIASESTITGSIGVIFSTTDLTGLYDKLGIKEIEVVNTQGKLKVLHDLSNENSEGYKLLQGVADDIYDNFVKVVASGRKKTVEEVRKLADGRVYSGVAAKANGLVDQIGEEKEARQAAADLANLANPAYVLYEDRSESSSLYGLTLLNLLRPELAAIQQVKPGINAYYLISTK